MPSIVLSAEEQQAMALGVKPPDLLVDMRYVYSNKQGPKITDGERALRAMLKESPREFFTQMTRLETVYEPLVVEAIQRAKEAESKKRSGEERPPDKGHDKLNELIDHLLQEWEDASN